MYVTHLKKTILLLVIIAEICFDKSMLGPVRATADRTAGSTNMLSCVGSLCVSCTIDETRNIVADRTVGRDSSGAARSADSELFILL